MQMFARRRVPHANVFRFSGFRFNWFSHNAPQDSVRKQLYTPAQRGTSPPSPMPLNAPKQYIPGSNRDRFTHLIFYAVVIVLGYLTFLIFAPFLVPLAWAGILVVLFHPLHERMARRW